MTSRPVAAVDLGASSGRVVVGEIGPRELVIREAHRFPNDPVGLPDGLHWDVLRLYHEVLVGLRAVASSTPDLVSVGIDSWGVDYGLLDESGALLGEPYHYRDRRTERGVAAVDAVIPRTRLYARTGVQFLPFNTIYQLASGGDARAVARARWLLLIPDLIAYWLSSVVGAEESNASTTGLFDATTRTWATDLLDELGLPGRILPIHRSPGTILGPLREAVAVETGLPRFTRLTLVGSHDTASAVVAVPTENERFAYISCGTWSLVGVELEAPILTEDSRAANFTNEGGVDGRIRYLRNVAGLWLLQESMRTWQRAGYGPDLEGLVEAAAQLAPGGPLFDPDDPIFLPPDGMPARIADAIVRGGQRAPSSRPALVRSILDSLAAAYARTIHEVERLSRQAVDVVHIVGGGSRNALLCQLTADACERPVIAGPVEATAIGNILVQARAHDIIKGDLATLRALVRKMQPLRRYEPRPARTAQLA